MMRWNESLFLLKGGNKLNPGWVTKFIKSTTVRNHHKVRNLSTITRLTVTPLTNPNPSSQWHQLRQFQTTNLLNHPTPTSTSTSPPPTTTTTTTSTPTNPGIELGPPTKPIVVEMVKGTGGISEYLKLARVDKPIGTMLLLWPCVWSIGMASYHLNLPLTTTFYTLGLFTTGAFVMRGAGCTINDLWDIKFDRQVARTQQRPLASGAILPYQAIGFLGLQLSAGLAVLVQLNFYSIALGASSLALVVVYPFMKRVTHWPQLVLGLAFNWGALLGWSAIAGNSHWAVTLPLYAAGVCWTLVYDTVYAHQDKVDDVQAGVKSTALFMGTDTKKYLTGFSVASLGFLSLSGYLNHHTFLFPAGIAAAGTYLAWDLYRVNLDDPASCWRHFNRHQIFGALVTAGIYSDLLLLHYS